MAKGPYPSDRQDQYMLRFPEGMRDQLKAAAEVNKRSMNAEIIARLEKSFIPLPMHLSDEGVLTLVRRLEATIDAFQDLYIDMRDAQKGTANQPDDRELEKKIVARLERAAKASLKGDAGLPKESPVQRLERTLKTSLKPKTQRGS